MEEDVTFKRIIALKDIPSFDVKAGTTGGWVTEKSIIEEGSWVSNNAILHDSQLKGNVMMKRHAYVVDSVIDGNGVIGGDTCIKESTVEVEGISLAGHTLILKSNVIGKTKQSTLSMDDNSHIIKSDVTIVDNQLTMNGTSRLILSEVHAVDMIFENAWVRTSEIEGSAISLKDVHLMEYSELKGENISLQNIRDIRKVVFKGVNINVSKIGALHSENIEGTNLHLEKIKEAISEMIQDALKSEPVTLEELFGDEVSVE